jgi:DNA-binding NtrC family response regulator
LENTCGKETNTENKPSTIKPPLPLQPLKETLAEVEKDAILQALDITNGNKQDAAKLLEIGKTSFYEKCKLYGIN